MRQAIAVLMSVTMLFPGCSIAILHATGDRTKTSQLDIGTPRAAVEEELGTPVETGRNSDGDPWAVYQQRVYRHPNHGSGDAIACLVLTLGLCEVVALPAAVMTTLMRIAFSSVYRISATYDHDGRVKQRGAWSRR